MRGWTSYRALCKRRETRVSGQQTGDHAWNAYVLLINIGAGSGDALQALPDDGHDLPFRVGKQDVGL